MSSLHAIIIKYRNSNTYPGFIRQPPGACAQADNEKGLDDKLNSYLKLWLSYTRGRKA